MALQDLSTEGQSIFDSVSAQLESYGLGELSATLVNLIQQYGSGMKETINAELRKTEAYKQRFAGNEARRSAGLSVLSESEYLYNERAYSETLKSYNAGDLATKSNFADFIAKDVSPAELSNRFSYAVERVQKADPALKSELLKMYPGISDNDIARSMILGEEGSNYLKTRVNQAEILAEASNAGLKLQSSAAELESLGVNRQQAAAGLQKVASIKSGMQQAAQMFGDNAAPEVLQKELESENLLGIQSARTKRLASQSRAQFGGQSGIKQGSLKRKTTIV